MRGLGELKFIYCTSEVKITTIRRFLKTLDKNILETSLLLFWPPDPDNLVLCSPYADQKKSLLRLAFLQ